MANVFNKYFVNVAAQLKGPAETSDFKHITEHFIWNGHFQYISKKITSSLWLLSQIKSFLSVDDKLLFYNAYIHPHIAV